jgi:hypothetical protein
VRTYIKMTLGVVPACLLTMSGLVAAPVLVTTHQKVLVISALLGTCGLIWSFVTYSRRTAVFVLALLVVGILAVLVGGIGGALSALARDVHYDRLGSPLGLSLRLLLVSWLFLGPTIVGLSQANRAVRVLRGVG